MSQFENIEFIISKPKILKTQENSLLLSMITILSIIRSGGNSDAIAIRKLYYLYECVSKGDQSVRMHSLISKPYDIPIHLQKVILVLSTNKLVEVKNKSGKIFVYLTDNGETSYQRLLDSTEFKNYLEFIANIVHGVTDTNLDKQQLRW